ncbi:hypothetical protein CKM354_001153300 [Cercospora kikuchii]|uniref:F-box domain-containing protein n=1 Tax=Cercospora kikuchii TaxID=84275 RepID=A0A9P3CPP3_9PEZI|nr:uncharacterized protein CKM354_001153300 [Cercospora kikuchii]GIZ48474.1 hypothetical protein CKM354_001153300 [Cercospora kikuchii]
MAETRCEYDGTAGAQVVAIPELMEMILHELPLEEVLAAQRVNKDFKNTIRESHKLQKALFFKPIDNTVLRPLSKQSAPPACTSPQVCHANSKKGDWLISEQQDPVTKWARQAPKSDEIPRTETLNPFVYKVVPPWLELIKRCELGRERRAQYFRINRDDLAPTAHSDLMALFPASLKEMQVFQPPASEVWLHCPAVFEATDEDGKCYEPHWHSIQARQGQPGVTVGGLKEHADRFGGMIELVIPFGTKILDQREFKRRRHVGPPGSDWRMRLTPIISKVVYELLEPNTEHVAVPSSPPLEGVIYCRRKPVSRFDPCVVGWHNRV